VRSNHPPCIIKQLPESINRRLSSISSDAETFDKSTPLYQQALKASGYSHQLKFTPTDATTTNRPNRRSRNIVWYNPPFSQSVASNIGHTFIRLLGKIFHQRHPLHKLFNRNNTKISYSCMPNLKQTINNHNKNLLADDHTQPPTGNKTCNCRKRDECPLQSHCLTESIIYQAIASTENNSKPDETYIGLTANPFKTRYNNHTASFRHETKRSATELSNYIWDLKEQIIRYNVKWTALGHARPYNAASKRCNLCILEKFYIISKPQCVH
jgi:hypothetical protein